MDADAKVALNADDCNIPKDSAPNWRRRTEEAEINDDADATSRESNENDDDAAADATSSESNENDDVTAADANSRKEKSPSAANTRRREQTPEWRRPSDLNTISEGTFSPKTYEYESSSSSPSPASSYENLNDKFDEKTLEYIPPISPTPSNNIICDVSLLPEGSDNEAADAGAISGADGDAAGATAGAAAQEIDEFQFIEEETHLDSSDESGPDYEPEPSVSVPDLIGPSRKPPIRKLFEEQSMKILNDYNW